MPRGSAAAGRAVRTVRTTRIEPHRSRDITAGYYRSLTDVSPATATKDLTAAVAGRLLVSKGERRGRRYFAGERLYPAVAVVGAFSDRVRKAICEVRSVVVVAIRPLPRTSRALGSAESRLLKGPKVRGLEDPGRVRDLQPPKLDRFVLFRSWNHQEGSPLEIGPLEAHREQHVGSLFTPTRRLNGWLVRRTDINVKRRGRVATG